MTVRTFALRPPFSPLFCRCFVCRRHHHRPQPLSYTIPLLLVYVYNIICLLECNPSRTLRRCCCCSCRVFRRSAPAFPLSLVKLPSSILLLCCTLRAITLCTHLIGTQGSTFFFTPNSPKALKILLVGVVLRSRSEIWDASVASHNIANAKRCTSTFQEEASQHRQQQQKSKKCALLTYRYLLCRLPSCCAKPTTQRAPKTSRARRALRNLKNVKYQRYLSAAKFKF